MSGHGAVAAGSGPRLGRVAAAVAAALVLTIAPGGCGVPLNGAPQDIPASALPSGLGEAASTTTATTGPRGTATVSASIYFVASEQVVPVSRRLPTPLTVSGVLDVLLSGPSTDERSKGLRSAIPAKTHLISVDVKSGIATINLSPNFTDVFASNEAVLAVAQVVITATQVPGVSAVQFQLSGVPEPVPDGGGAITSNPVGPAFYQSVQPQ